MAVKINGTTVIDDSRNITNVGTVDGRTVSNDGSKLDGISTGADVTSDALPSALTGLGTTTDVASGDTIPVYDDSTSTWKKATITNAALQGPKGQKGQTGATGAAGSKGQKGEVGATGATGATGSTGATGATGSKGQKGEVGATGATGAKGQKGTTGAAGSNGATGAKGQKGEVGATGAGGATGSKGQKGQTGATGATGAVGPKGSTGNTGATGATGPAGTNGTNGAKGQKGQAGSNGSNGAKGQKGEVGATGSGGATGAKGQKGEVGQKGQKGEVGQKGQKGELADGMAITVYDNTGGQNVNSGAVLNLDTTAHTTSTQTFALSNDVLTINASDVFTFHLEVTTGISSGAGRSVSKAYLQEYNGSTWSTVDGTTVYMYNRLDGRDEATGAATFTRSVTSGYGYRVYVIRHTGTDNIVTVADASRLTVVGVSGGTQGPQGTGSVAGPAGATGAKGQKGQTGATGATGSTGSTGAKGQKGETGATGAGGAKGQKGEVGATGATGAKGSTGATGAAGSDGATGAKGQKGQKGQTGATGSTGSTGATGAGGAKGQKGEVGATGAAGSNGSNGAKGQKGQKGATGATGAAGSNGSNGAKGQKGQKGATGAAGSNGSNGSNGAKGQKGEVGPSAVTSSSVTIGSGVVLEESTDRPDLLQITSSTSTWGGLQIRNSSNEGRWSFMTDGSTAGIYDDENGDWHLQMTENAGVTLYHNGVANFTTGATYMEMARHLDMNNYDIYGCDQFFHHGDTNTYMQFHAEDQWRVVTGGVERLEVNNSQIYATQEIRCTQNITAYYSDERLKTKVGDIDNALDKIKSLDAFYYVENDLAKSLGYDNDDRQVALSAQQVQEVMPEAVHPAPFDVDVTDDGKTYSVSGEDYLTVDYARLVPLLVEAIKEQQAQIEELKDGITN